MTGCQWCIIELRRSPQPLRGLGELPQAPGDLYNDPAHAANDGHRRNDNG